MFNVTDDVTLVPERGEGVSVPPVLPPPHPASIPAMRLAPASRLVMVM
jgi:hypothetical protein